MKHPTTAEIRKAIKVLQAHEVEYKNIGDILGYCGHCDRIHALSVAKKNCFSKLKKHIQEIIKNNK